ncbi:hypothetical protein Raf01_33110 [Rugosimonospora africana]|uniref:DUF6603 domain-containing protein n=1 Tax=Rugosimonospora africana TaxID=556532 RepID=A0A8J3QR94_9ACTN|nr:hypothetical protein Raf01_33110 [Rugosimonospora africana]
MRPLTYAVTEDPVGSGVVRLAQECGYDLGPVLTPERAGQFADSVTALHRALCLITFDPAGLLPRLPEALGQVADLYNELAGLDDLLPPSSQLGARLFDYLLATYLERRSPTLYALLALVGLIRETPVPADGDVPAYVRREVHWDQVARLTDPAALFADVYGWGSDTLDAGPLLARLADLLWATGLPARYQPGETAHDDGYLEVGWVLDPDTGDSVLGLRAQTAPRQGDELPGLALVPTAPSTVGYDADLGGGWQLSLTLAAGAEVGYQLTIRPTTGADLETTGGKPTGWDLSAELVVSKSATTDERTILFGSADASRFEVRTVSLRGFAESGSETTDVGVEFTVRGGRLVVAPAEGDAFLRGVLPGGGLFADVEFVLGWSSTAGLYFAGGVGLRATIPLDLPIGPITLVSLTLTVAADTGGQLEATAALTAALSLGPIAASIDRVGITALITTTPPFALASAFKPPDGIGVGLDVGVASGGGYLYIDPDAGSYNGVLDLRLLGIGIGAVVIIDTRAPEVGDWSMFFALFLDLPSLQLGFGFTLLGVGGVAGINRAIDTDALGALVRSGSLDAILFPADPVADAPAIIDEFRSIFPPAQDSYVFGPIVKIGWGTPTLVEADLGVVIQLPDPVVVAVLGTVSAVLPTKDVDLVVLNLDVTGVVDVGAATLAIDASLHDSHVVGYALAGDMALRAGFGDEQSFLMALGGFHPLFDPPANFPDLRRLSLGISAGDELRVDFQCYLALASNSVQFGADFVLDAEVLGFAVHGSCGFDTLVQFSPFEINTSVHFGVSITAVGVDLMGVMLHASIEGPNRWHVIGTATFEILGLPKDIRVDELIGPAESEPKVRAPDLLTDLVTALDADDAWQVVGGDDDAVTFVADSATSAQRAATPDSLIEVRQTLVPLGLALQQFGNAPIGAYSTFDAGSGDGRAAQELRDWFAPGYFLTLSSADKLEGPSFELMRSGLRFGGGDPAAGKSVTVDTGYRSIVLDPELPEADTASGYTAVLDAPAGVPALARTVGGFSATQDVAVDTVATSYRLVDGTGSTLAHSASWAGLFAAARTGTDLHIERETSGVGR